MADFYGDCTDLWGDGKLRLSLDISQTSTGFALVERDGSIITGNITLDDAGEDGLLTATRRKEQLKSDILGILEGRGVLDLCIVEDVFFQGYVNSMVKLLQLNQVMEELVYQRDVEVGELVKVQSTTWKSWLRRGIPDLEDQGKGEQGKKFVSTALATMKVDFSGKGFQDRLDAFGMLVGYRLIGEDLAVKIGPERLKVAHFEEESDLELLANGREVRELDIKGSIGQTQMLSELKKSPDTLFFTNSEVSLGFDNTRLKFVRKFEDGKKHRVAFYADGFDTIGKVWRPG